MLIDSHCHLDYLAANLDEAAFKAVLQAAWDNDIEHILNVCVTLDKFPGVLAIANAYPKKISCSVGLHPSEKAENEPSIEEIVALANNPLVVAIGETGLDYHYDDVLKDIQQARFRTHIRAAKQLKKPLIIHTREGNDDLIAILKEEGASDVGGVMHCFTENWEMAKLVLDLGFYIGFSGIVTFRNAEQCREVAKKVPIDCVLVETDAPYLAPVPKRGKQNEPAFVKYVAEFMADLRKMRFDEFATQTTENFYRLFRSLEAGGRS